MKKDKRSDGSDRLDGADRSKKERKNHPGVPWCLGAFVAIFKSAEIGQKRAQGSRLYDCLHQRPFKRFKDGLCDEILKNVYYSHYSKKAFKELKLNLNEGYIGVKVPLKKTAVLGRNGQKSEMGKKDAHGIHGKHRKK